MRGAVDVQCCSCGSVFFLLKREITVFGALKRRDTTGLSAFLLFLFQTTVMLNTKDTVADALLETSFFFCFLSRTCSFHYSYSY